MNSIIRIIPLYYLSLLVFIGFTFFGLISEEYSIQNLLSHFFLINFVNPYWFGTFGGTGYIGVLVLCWLLLPIYLRLSKTFEKSLCGMVIIIISSEILSVFLRRYSLISDKILWQDWVLYIFRGFESFSTGVFLYNALKIVNINVFLSKRSAYYIAVLDLFYILMLCNLNITSNILYLLALIPLIFVLSVFPIKFLVNPIISFLGKYIFGLYFSHILLYFVLSKYVNSKPLLWCMDIFFALAISIIVCDLYEKNILKLIRASFFRRISK